MDWIGHKKGLEKKGGTKMHENLKERIESILGQLDYFRGHL